MKMFKAMTMGILALALGACGAVDSGNGGVRISWDNKVQNEIVTEGFYTSVLSSVEEWVGKEILIELNDMTPKVGDNLKMQELDVHVYYSTDISSFPSLKRKYANATVYEDGYAYPAYKMVTGAARTVIYEAIGRQKDSLKIHQNREIIADLIKELAQEKLDLDDPGVFTITKVFIKKANTDASLEDSIRLAIKKDKELEAAEKDEDIEAAKARANIALNSSLTPAIMRVKELDAMIKACQKGTCIIDFTNGGITPMIQIRQ